MTFQLNGVPRGIACALSMSHQVMFEKRVYILAYCTAYTAEALRQAKIRNQKSQSQTVRMAMKT